MSLTSLTWAPGQTLLKVRLRSLPGPFSTLGLRYSPGFFSPREGAPLITLICSLVVPGAPDGMPMSPSCALAVWGVVLGWVSDGTSSPAVPWHLLQDVQGVRGWL